LSKTAVIFAFWMLLQPCHMPDVIEMPLSPRVVDAGKPNEYPVYLPPCRTRPVLQEIGDRRLFFQTASQAGDRLVFEDMAIILW
jgi:hypothetical protein